jgi:hypothetical protein
LHTPTEPVGVATLNAGVQGLLIVLLNVDPLVGMHCEKAHVPLAHTPSAGKLSLPINSHAPPVCPGVQIVGVVPVEHVPAEVHDPVTEPVPIHGKPMLLVTSAQRALFNAHTPNDVHEPGTNDFSTPCMFNWKHC